MLRRADLSPQIRGRFVCKLAGSLTTSSNCRHPHRPHHPHHARPERSRHYVGRVPRLAGDIRLCYAPFALHGYEPPRRPQYQRSCVRCRPVPSRIRIANTHNCHRAECGPCAVPYSTKVSKRTLDPAIQTPPTSPAAEKPAGQRSSFCPSAYPLHELLLVRWKRQNSRMYPGGALLGLQTPSGRLARALQPWLRGLLSLGGAISGQRHDGTSPRRLRRGSGARERAVPAH